MQFLLQLGQMKGPGFNSMPPMISKSNSSLIEICCLVVLIKNSISRGYSTWECWVQSAGIPVADVVAVGIVVVGRRPPLHDHCCKKRKGEKGKVSCYDFGMCRGGVCLCLL